MKLTREEYRDLVFALDALRYGNHNNVERFTKSFLEYSPGTEGHERTVKLYEKLSKMVQA